MGESVRDFPRSPTRDGGEQALARGLAARARGALGEAEAAGHEASRSLPEDPRVWVLLGSLVHLRGALAEAATLYRRALAVAPADGCAHAALAVALTQDHQPVTAGAHFAAALRGGLEPWTWLRTLRQAREVGQAGPANAWEACATPLFGPQGHMSESTGGREGTDPRPAVVGRVTWTITELAAALRAGSRIVALTGAGLSAASGLETRKQLWQRFTRDEAVSAVRFHDDPTTLWTVIRAFWGEVDPTPNVAHQVLARLPGLTSIITQNVDGLHQAAGGQVPVLELHGSLLRTHCIVCTKPGAPAPRLARGELPPRCACGGVLRPEVVLFGERVPSPVLAAATAAVATAQVLLVIGCAMDVSPASELPVLAAAAGAMVVEIKRRPSRLAGVVRVHHVAGTAEVVLPAVEAKR